MTTSMRRRASGNRIRVGRIIWTSFKTVVRNALPFGLLVVLAVTPLVALDMVTSTATGYFGGPFNLEGEPFSLAVLVASRLGALLFGALLTAVATVRTHDVLTGSVTDFRRYLGAVWMAAPIAVVAVFTTTLGQVGFEAVLNINVILMPLILPGLALYVFYLVAIPVLAVERTGVISSLGQSARLARHDIGRVFFTVLLVLAVGTILPRLLIPALLAAFSLLPSGILYSLPSNLFVMAAPWIARAITWLFLSVVIAAVYCALLQVVEGSSRGRDEAVFD